MNLHGIARGLIAAVNPEQVCLLETSTGYTTDASGHRTPTYSNSYPIAQVQSLTTQDIRQLDALNVQGSERKIYLSGVASAIQRVASKGGDVITLSSDGTVWLTTAVLEQWPDWVAVSVTMQNRIVPLKTLDQNDPANAKYLPLL